MLLALYHILVSGFVKSWRMSGSLPYFKPVTMPKVTQNKVACKIAGMVLSLIIISLFLMLVLGLGSAKPGYWIVFVLAAICLGYLNRIYLKLIDNLFEKLNQK